MMLCVNINQPYEIMANVKANLSRNYTTGEKDQKKCCFIEI
jgi:hypothetical protein